MRISTYAKISKKRTKKKERNEKDRFTPVSNLEEDKKNVEESLPVQ